MSKVKLVDPRHFLFSAAPSSATVACKLNELCEMFRLDKTGNVEALRTGVLDYIADHTNEDGETQVLREEHDTLVAVIASCSLASRVLNRTGRKLEGLDLFCQAISLQRVLQHHSLYEVDDEDDGSDEETDDRSLKLLSVDRLCALKYTLNRGQCLFEENQFLAAAHDFMAVKKVLSRSVSRARNLVAMAKACDEAAKKSVLWIEKALDREGPLMGEVLSTLSMNAATCLRGYGAIAEAEAWLSASEDLEKVAIDLELCHLVRCAPTPDDLATVIGHINAATTPSNIANALALIQLCVQYNVSEYANSLISNGVSEAEAINTACTILVPELTGNQVESLEKLVNDGAPENFFSTAPKGTIHALATVMDFETAYRMMDVWNATAVAHSTNARQLFPQSVDLVNWDLIDKIIHRCSKPELMEISTATVVSVAQRVDVLIGQLGAILRPYGYRFAVDNMEGPFTPLVSGAAAPMLLDEQRTSLHQYFPLQHQRFHWHCLYSTKDHGTSINTLYAKTNKISPLIMCVRTGHSTFGAFLGAPIKVSLKYHGVGESFVFRFDDPESEAIKVFKWTMENDYFFFGQTTGISVGGGGLGPAIHLAENLMSGSSYACSTFGSPPLDAGGEDFEVFAIEIYTVQMPRRFPRKKQ